MGGLEANYEHYQRGFLAGGRAGLEAAANKMDERAEKHERNAGSSIDALYSLPQSAAARVR